MKKFKSIFYGICVLYFTFSVFIGYSYENIVLHWKWDGISSWEVFIRFMVSMGAVGIVLFITEIIVENVHLFSKRREIKSLEDDILHLKSKLYDQSQPPAEAEDSSDSDESEESKE